MINLPDDLSRKYRYKYSATWFAGSWRHSYELIGRHGGVNVHFSGPHRYDNADHWSAGVEFHYREPPEHMRDDAPSHDRCWLLECPCWHDGSSVWAQEQFMPLFLAGQHDSIFCRMIDAANEKFAMKCAECAT